VTGPVDRGTLVLVATPIGNLGDLSPRAREVLAEAALVCCEDTRRTRGLLSAMGIGASGPDGDRLLSLHEHNEASRVARVRQVLAAGGTVAVVSDAGTPGISDPGSLLVAALAAEGEVVSTVPGPSSVLGALVVSGLPTDRFCVEGFLPRKGAARRVRVAAVMADQRTTVVLEAPGRVGATLEDLAAHDPDRPLALVRELTKLHEEVWRGTLAQGAERWGGEAPRGEVVLVVGGAAAPGPVDDDAIESAVRERLSEPGGAEAGVRQLADQVATELGIGRKRVYDLVLALRGEAGGP
jgi:16S rRNA (cytidine1402-2'-O)-methyltransferase